MNVLSCFPSPCRVFSGVVNRATKTVHSLFRTNPVQQDLFVPGNEDFSTPSPAQVLSGIRDSLIHVTAAILVKEMHYEEGCDELEQNIRVLMAGPKTSDTRAALKKQRAKLKRRLARKKALTKAFNANLKLDREIAQALGVQNQAELQRLQRKVEQRIDQQVQLFHLQ